MKYLGLSPNGKLAKFGEDLKTAKWYNVNEDIKKQLDAMKKEDMVTILSEQRAGAYHLTFVAKGQVEAPKEQKVAPKAAPELKTETKTAFVREKEAPKLAEIKEPVKEVKIVAEAKEKPLTEWKIECLKATSRIMISLQGQIDEKNVAVIAEKIFKTLLAW